ncbi:MAG: methylated-DNA--[protein]-cysteine S-methyltransferase [Erysipelotrichia bacterium]|nr:methylated-DNA--[protein]-cysteine S-methyltransferase [Erysipelotrichia bacterium]NCC55511.1 methylated-DNA--[protein]-cysteine S-methyltransferase [Erysipelotrichia bacterium]
MKEDEVGICELTLYEPSKIKSEDKHYCSSLIKTCMQQLNQYLQGKRKTFTIALHPHGTIFQQKVWQALCEIPYGETRTYEQIAIAINQPKSYRAVGMANHNNPIAILIPCHRVIGKNHSLVGYALGLEMKQILLSLESK